MVAVANGSLASLRGDLLDRLLEARARTDELFQIVRADSLYERPIDERHRIVFYIGHLEAFDWNLLSTRLLKMQSFNAELDRLFAFGIDPVGGGLPTDSASDWPAIAEVRGYVREVRQRIDGRIGTALNEDPATFEFSPELLLNVAIEHRLMHAETLAYMLHRLPFDRKIAPLHSLQTMAPAAAPEMITIPSGQITLGLSRQSGLFGWDNEFELHATSVPEFAIDRYKVTNREYLEFIADRGYERADLWTDSDWKWRGENGIHHPAFWVQKNGTWFWRGMFADVELPMNWPVYVSHAEASAYARWAGKALPTEEQWQRAAYGVGDAESRNSSRALLRGNFDFRHWDPVPVTSDSEGSSRFGVHGMTGNGWEWTSTVFHPFEGFRPFPFYRGYSADFFDGKHFVIKGASSRTAAALVRPSFRNWFQPHYQYVYCGFRCVSSSI